MSNFTQDILLLKRMLEAEREELKQAPPPETLREALVRAIVESSYAQALSAGQMIELGGELSDAVERFQRGEGSKPPGSCL